MATLLGMRKMPFAEHTPTVWCPVYEATGWSVIPHHPQLQAHRCDHKTSACPKCWTDWATHWYLVIERDDGSAIAMGEEVPREAVDWSTAPPISDGWG